MKKLTEEDLAKGLSALSAVAVQNNVAARRTELLAKANAGQASDEERDELIKSLSGNDLATRATEGFKTDEIKKSLDVSEFLKDMTAGVSQGLEVLAEQMQKSQVDEGNFRIALATTLCGFNDVLSAQSEIIKSQGELLKSLAGQAATQPARGPKSMGLTAAPAAKVLQKSFGGAVGAQPARSSDISLSDDQIFTAMEGLQKSGTTHIGGEDLMKAVTQFESLRQVSEPVMAAVQAFVAKTAS